MTLTATVNPTQVQMVDVEGEEQTVTASKTTPRISVMGVGGAGTNAVNNMMRANLQGVNFIVANTDSQALSQSQASCKLQLGLELTQGLGAGSKPEVGKAAAEETMAEIERQIADSNMVFVTAGMGGGTGTGAAPVIAKIARDKGLLTVGVVTKPFHFEGAHRMRTAEEGIDELQQHVDTLIIIPNQNLFRVANEQTTFADAFKMADDVLYDGVRSVTDLMIIPGLINLDFADIRAVMTEMGKAMMGTGEANGENRAILAAEAAISNPLLDDVSMKGAKGVLISVTGGGDMTLYEVDEAANRIRDEVEVDANIIFGSTFDENLNGKIRVSVVATGIDHDSVNTISTNPAAIDADAEEAFAEPNLDHNDENSDNVFNINLGVEPDSTDSLETVDSGSEDTPIFGEEALNLAEDRYDATIPAEDAITETITNHQPPQSYSTATSKRPTLFERFTRAMKGKDSTVKEEQVSSVHSLRVRTSSGNTTATNEEEEVSDIPAFLRRQSK